MPNKTRAPYNFVPFSNRVFARYASEAELPGHDRIFSELKSGEIHVTLTANTPVFVSDENKRFYRTPDNTLSIPGSTVRGLIRENMQILGFGLVRPGEDLDDCQIFFREMAAATKLNEKYCGALDVQSRKSTLNKTYSIPENVLSGYLCRKGDSYFIKPTKGRYLRISRSHPIFKSIGEDSARVVPVSYTIGRDGNLAAIQKDKVGGMERGNLLFTGDPVGTNYKFYELTDTAFIVSKSHPDIADFVRNGKDLKTPIMVSYDDTEKDLKLCLGKWEKEKKMKHGILLPSGTDAADYKIWSEERSLKIKKNDPIFQEIGKYPAPTLVSIIREEQGNARGIRTGWAEKMIHGIVLTEKAPNHLYVFPEADNNAEAVPISETDKISYKQDLKARQNSLGSNVNFWALPEEGEEKPVFYIRYEGHTYFGMSLFLRIGYQHSLAEGLPDRHKEKLGRELDYPHAILGFADKDRAYRSRVSFEDFRLISETIESNEIKTVLMEPKPSWYTGYVTDAKNYMDDSFKLRGYKQYWLHELNAEKPLEEKENAKFISTLRPLPEESKFSGVIRYKNLNEDELGLLLWSLRLDDGCYQSLGMGKPYGFGRMKVEIDSLREYDFARLYSLDSLNGLSYQESKEKVGAYISAYEAFAEQKFFGEADNSGKKKKNRTLRGQASIQDFFFLHRTIREKEAVSYMMDLKEYREISPLETIKDVRKELTQEEKADEPDLSKMSAVKRAFYEAKHNKK